MIRLFLLLALMLTLAGCGFFEWLVSTPDDGRQSPIAEAAKEAGQAYTDTKAKVPEIPVPGGFPAETLGIIAGGIAAAVTFVTVLVRRRRQDTGKVVEVAAPPPPPVLGGGT